MSTKLRKPSQRTIDLYNQLVSEQNKVRKRLLRIHKRAEEAVGAGRLPALIIPKRAHKIKHNYFDVDKATLKRRLQAFWKRYREAKAYFGQGIKSYLSKTLKEGYMELWRERMADEESGLGLEPEGYRNNFSKEQLEEMTKDQRKVAEIYNFLNRLSPEVFLALLYRGKLIQFQFIYEEMSGIRDKENSWVYQQAELLAPYHSKQNQIELLNQDSIMRDEEAKVRYNTKEGKTREMTPSGEHRKETVKEAERRRQNAEEDN